MIGLGWLSNLFGRVAGGSSPLRQRVATLEGRVREEMGKSRVLQARYEAAETTRENAPLWPLADYLSARAANSYQVRRTLKIRSRYEYANNSYYRGMVDTLADDLVGRGPTLQIRSPDVATNKAIQKRFHEWAGAIGLGEALRTMAKSKCVDGEGIGLNVTNRRLRQTFGGPWTDVDDIVQLDVCVIESDQMTTPDLGFADYFAVDGILLDRQGKPVEYHVLRQHPGDLLNQQFNPLVYDRWKPADVSHWLRVHRPGQVRGVPEITPALELFAQLRRYTKAVIQAAETAADFAAVLKTEAGANDDPNDPANSGGLMPFDSSPIDRGLMTALPSGYELTQLKAEQPSTTYEMFVRVIIREICRCLDVPLSIALGDASQSNYSSARMEHLRYHRRQQVDRALCEDHCLRKLFAAWYAEALLVAQTTPGYLPRGLPPTLPPHRWLWPRADSIDPVKDATADGIELGNNTQTLAAIYAERGEDWEEAVEQRGREVAALKAAGITPPEPAPAKGPGGAAKPGKKPLAAADGQRRRKKKPFRPLFGATLPTSRGTITDSLRTRG